jgi:N-acetylglucosamine malate deacetylase 1
MKSVLAIAAHPDDIEFLMTGTLLLLKERGYQIHYFNLANGCCGSSTQSREAIAERRRAEAQAAADLLGAIYYESICNDLEIFYNQPTLAQVTAVVRAAQPEIVLTHAPIDYMEDHTNTCRLAVTATFSRGMPNFVTQPPVSAITGKTTLYHAQPYQHRDPLGRVVEPELFLDISEHIDTKQAILAQHQSQKQWLDESQGQDSYLLTMRELDAECGRISGMFSFAEGWRRHWHVGFCDERDDPLRTVLAGKVLPA